MSPTVRFTRHAVQRVKERFANDIGTLVSIIDKEIAECADSPYIGQSRVVSGVIRGRSVKVVLEEDCSGQFVVITAMWHTPA